MNVKCAWLKTLAVMLLGAGVLRSQERAAPYGQSGATQAGPTLLYGQTGSTPVQQLPSPAPNGGPAPGNGQAPPTPEQPGMLSSWITYARECCCFPTEGAPIGNELFIRNGLSVPIGAKNMSETLRPGWDLEGGFHVSYFNQPCTAAWTVDLSISNEFNTANSDHSYHVENVFAGISGPLIPAIDLVVKSTDRTSFNYGVGREWYLWGSACDDCHENLHPNWRWGIDVGGRWGTEKMNFQNFPHRTEEFLGTYADIHVDYMFPWRCYLFFVGLRAEWDYDRIHHILHENDTDVTEFNFILDAGVRF